MHPGMMVNGTKDPGMKRRRAGIWITRRSGVSDDPEAYLFREGVLAKEW